MRLEPRPPELGPAVDREPLLVHAEAVAPVFEHVELGRAACSEPRPVGVEHALAHEVVRRHEQERGRGVVGNCAFEAPAVDQCDEIRPLRGIRRDRGVHRDGRASREPDHRNAGRVDAELVCVFAHDAHRLTAVGERTLHRRVPHRGRPHRRLRGRERHQPGHHLLEREIEVLVGRPGVDEPVLEQERRHPARREPRRELESLVLRAQHLEPAAGHDHDRGARCDTRVGRHHGDPRVHDVAGHAPGAERAVRLAVGPLLGAGRNARPQRDHDVAHAASPRVGRCGLRRGPSVATLTVTHRRPPVPDRGEATHRWRTRPRRAGALATDPIERRS